MYVSRLSFQTQPGQTHEVEQRLTELRDLVAEAGGGHPRVLRSHYGSLGAPDLVLEQDAADLAELERQLEAVMSTERFRALSQEISGRLGATPKREVYRIIG